MARKIYHPYPINPQISKATGSRNYQRLSTHPEREVQTIPKLRGREEIVFANVEKLGV